MCRTVKQQEASQNFAASGLSSFGCDAGFKEGGEIKKSLEREREA